MTEAVPWSPEKDAVPVPTRQQRDQYFDKLIGLPSALTPENMKSSGFSEGAWLGVPKEILDVPNRAVVIASFTSYQPVLSKSGRSIYTEVTLSVSHIFQDPADHQPGRDIVLILPGGTVKTDSGVALSFLVQPRHYSITIGRTYLFVLSYHSAGSFYMLAQDWDLTSGVAQRNFSVPKQTPATLVGLTVQELIDKLNTELSNEGSVR